MRKQRCSTCTEEDDPVVIKINQNQKSCHCTSPRSPEKVAPFPFKEHTKTACVVSTPQPSSEKTVGAEVSESTLSIVDINDKLPVLVAREHGPRCALEVSILEKHAEGCSKKKIDRGGRHPLDDKAGSYDVVSRMVYRTCGGSIHEGSIKSSAKGFKLNDPAWFGKELKEKRSRVETLPILSNYDNCVMRVQGSPLKKTHIPRAICAKDEPGAQPFLELPKSKDNLEVLSVYIRTDKSEKVPCGFQKMHYRGDSCKLHDPNERTKQILALQKVITETSSGAELSKSTKTFNQERETQIMTASIPTITIPNIMYPPVTMKESEESIENKNIIVSSKKIDTDSYNDESIEVLPQNLGNSSQEEDSPTGLFRCFKKNKQKRQYSEPLSYEGRNRKVTHNENQPRRYSGPSSHGATSPRIYSPYPQKH